MTTATATTYQPVRSPLVAAALAATLAIGAVAGNAMVARSSSPVAPASPPAASTTPATRLVALGFTATQANQLIRQLDTNPGLGQRVAAERIAFATVNGSAHIFGTSVREAPHPVAAR